MTSTYNDGTKCRFPIDRRNRMQDCTNRAFAGSGCVRAYYYFFGPQQSPAVAAPRSASCLISQLLSLPPFSSTISPKSRARLSQITASSISLADKPRGLCVVQRMYVVLYTCIGGTKKKVSVSACVCMYRRDVKGSVYKGVHVHGREAKLLLLEGHKRVENGGKDPFFSPSLVQ